MYSIEPTSSPRVGWEATSSLIGRENSRATITFCWLPPESVPTSTSGDGVRMSNSSTSSVGMIQDRLPLQDGPLGERRLVVGVQHQVVGDWERQHQPIALAVFRDVRRSPAR